MSRLSVETEYDKAVTALAQSLARCSWCRNNNTSKCTTCSTKIMQTNVYNSLSDMDRLRVQNEQAAIEAANPPPHEETFKEKLDVTLSSIWSCLPSILLLIAVIVILVVIQYNVNATTPGYNKIQTCLKTTVANIRDVNDDNKINCLDYAIVFKYTWDANNNPADCELVRNLHKDFNHLFVRIKWNNEWVYVEPSAYFYGCMYAYTMQEFWGDRYDSRYNFYNETEYWMSYDKSNR